MNMKRTFSALSIIASVAALLGILFAAPAAHATHQFNGNPVIFVHGGAGSGAQFESQAQRFTSNGYPQRYIKVLEYDSPAIGTILLQVHAQLDALIAQLQADTGAAQVDILGHSLGTFVMQSYLNSSPLRAANVAHYVNIDGSQAASPPGGVPTLAIWAGRGTPGRTIGGATNVTIPNQTHVQSATSEESFVEMYTFFTGEAPDTSDIKPSFFLFPVSGRAVNFPANTGVEGATLLIYEVDGDTGQRRRYFGHFTFPVGFFQLSGDGSWGPFIAKRGSHYEFDIVREDGTEHHLYYEPFLRGDHLVRLLTSVPGTGLDALVDRSDNHTSLVVNRYKEMWGDQGVENDIVEINGTNVCNAATCPINKRVIGMFAFDKGSDGVSNVAAPIAAFFAQPFISGVDLFIPASADASGTASVDLLSRGAGPVRSVNFPNFPSTTDRVTVQLNDFEQ